jgi:hypothetical protein
MLLAQSRPDRAILADEMIGSSWFSYVPDLEIFHQIDNEVWFRHILYGARLFSAMLVNSDD